MGGGDGAVRLYEECISYIKLERPSDFPKAFRSNGRRIRSSVISMEPISIERLVTYDIYIPQILNHPCYVKSVYCEYVTYNYDD